MERFYRADDAHMQLNEAVVMSAKYGPVYLSSNEDWTFNVLELSTSRWLDEPLHVKDIELTFEPLELGYLNRSNKLGRNGVLYVVREPRRMWKAGLTTGNIHVYGEKVAEVKVSTLLKSKSMYLTLINSFPTLQDCLNTVVQEGGEMAFHRHFSINRKSFEQGINEVKLNYKGEEVGELSPTPSGYCFKLRHSYSYLKEALDEVLNNNAYDS